MKRIQLIIISLCIGVSISSRPSVKMNIQVTRNQMKLTCTVSKRDSRFNIYLHCPLRSICRENCKSFCEKHHIDCPEDKKILCIDKGIDSITGLYEIDYIIDGTDPSNDGKWNCSHASVHSQSITVDVHAGFRTTTNKSIFVDMTKPREIVRDSKTTATSSLVNPLKNLDTERILPMEYSKLLTKSEFILSVIGLLAVSLIFNIFFCSRILFVKCKWKKPHYGNGDYFSMQQNQRPLNRCNSQVSDPERIYEDTSTPLRNMSLLTKIKQANGNYVGQSTLSPSSGPPTLLPPNYLPLNHSLSYSGSQNDNGNHVISTPTQIYYPLPADPTQTNYGALGFHTDNQYTNFLSVQQEMNHRDPNNQPLYLAFSPSHPFIPTNSRYLQYANQQPIPMVVDPANSSTNINSGKPSPVPSQLKNGLVQNNNNEPDNYQLSREMMEEADNLLRTADTLLKSTEQDMELIQ